MQRNYKHLKIRLIAMVLLVAVLGNMGLVLYKAKEIQSDYLPRMYNENCNKVDRAYRKTLAIDEKPNDKIAESFFYQELQDAGLNNQIGFYAVLTDSNNNIMAKTQNMLIVGNDLDDTKKFILLGNRVEEKTIKWDLLHYMHIAGKVKVKGYEDEYFIYPKKISFECLEHDKKHTLKLSENVYIPENAKSIEYGLKGYDIEINDCYCVESKGDREAKELITDVMNITNDDDNVLYEKRNIFKTIVMIKDNHEGSFYNAYAVAVIYPFMMAVKEVLGGIIMISLVTIILIFIIVFWINKIIRFQEAYDKMRNEFACGVAHEFKTPLAIIKSYTENWDCIDKEDKPVYSKRISDEVDKLSNLVSEFIELSRLEDKKINLNIESVDLISLSQTVISLLNPIAKELNLVISFEHNEQEILIDADLEMIKKVIQNFATNAIKHAKKEITVKIIKLNKCVRLSISNDGKMIDKEQVVKIWDAFYKGKDEKNSQFGSTGVGLSVAKNILELHHFKYGCNSIEGQTTFWFETEIQNNNSMKSF